MYTLKAQQLIDYLRLQPETDMGYWVVSAILKDGRRFDQVLINSGCVTQVRGHADIPFEESQIDRLIVTHEKWDFSGT
jgi:hypothetical protein